MHRNGGWLGQLRRVERWRERLAAAARGDGSDDDFADIAYAFFQNCWALVDWVRRSSDVDKKTLAEFTAREPMRLCRDLANGTKHLDLSSASVDAGFSIQREHQRGSARGYRLVVIVNDAEIGGRLRDLLDLASECLECWHSFAYQRPPRTERATGNSA